jgi:hypothetical protein
MNTSDAFRPASVIALALLMLIACERQTYEPKPPAATPALPPGPTGSAASAGGAGSAAAPDAAPPAAAAPLATAPLARPGQSGARTLNELGPISGPNDPANTLRVGGISAPKPVEWSWVTPANAFRNLQYAVPAQGGSGSAAELIISGFVAGDGGPLQQNIDRWVGSFVSETGGPVTPILEEREVDGLKVNLVELRGKFRDMGGGQHPGSLQLAAIVDVPGGRVFMRLVGPEATVEGWRDAWQTLVAGIKLDSQSPAGG